MIPPLPTNRTDRAIDYVQAHSTRSEFLRSLSLYILVNGTLTAKQVNAVEEIIRCERYEAVEKSKRF